MAATARDLSKAESVIQLKGVNKWYGHSTFCPTSIST